MVHHLIVLEVARDAESYSPADFLAVFCDEGRAPVPCDFLGGPREWCPPRPRERVLARVGAASLHLQRWLSNVGC